LALCGFQEGLLKNPITDFQDRQNGEISDISKVESWRSSQMVLSPVPPHQVASIRDMKRPMMKPRSMMKMAMPGKHELMIRRAANHNAHIITPPRQSSGRPQGSQGMRNQMIVR
jgi:hypothetical protein